MSDTRDLYQELILDHGKRPRNFRVLADADRTAEGYNPLCGDRCDVFVKLDERGAISDVTFQGKGCAISTASASMMSQAAKGLDKAGVQRLFDLFHDLVTGKSAPADTDDAGLGKLEVFAGVREYPNRVKCASLAWHTLMAALDQTQDRVSTE